MSDKTITIDVGLGGNWTTRQLREPSSNMDGQCLDQLKNFLANAIDAQHPPRMDEPGWGEQVTVRVFATTDGTNRVTLIHYRREGGKQWTDGGDNYYDWDELPDPRPIGLSLSGDQNG